MDLLSAVNDGNSSAALEIIAEGADVRAIDENGESVLHFAVWRKDETFISVLEALITNGAFVDARSNSNCTPLHFAAFRGNVPAIELLVTKGANINAVEKDGTTPLHNAVKRSDVEAVALLIMFGADVNVVGGVCGTTPLHYAARNGSVPAIEALLASGADVNALNIDGLTPLGYITSSRSPSDSAVVCLNAAGGIGSQ